MTISPIFAHGTMILPLMAALYGCIALFIAVFGLCSRSASKRKIGKNALWCGVGLIIASIFLVIIVSKL